MGHMTDIILFGGEHDHLTIGIPVRGDIVDQRMRIENTTYSRVCVFHPTPQRGNWVVIYCCIGSNEMQFSNSSERAIACMSMLEKHPEMDARVANWMTRECCFPAYHVCHESIEGASLAFMSAVSNMAIRLGIQRIASMSENMLGNQSV